MSAKASVELSGDPGRDEHILCTVRVLDRSMIGHDATLELRRQVRVKDSRPVNAHILLTRRKFRLTGAETEFHIPTGQLGHGFAYSGPQIEMCLRTVLTIDDALIFDTKVEGEHRLRSLPRPKISGRAKELAEPADRFDFFRNLRAIPFRSQVLTLALAAVGGILMAINALVGLHDQFVPEMQTWIYSHTDSDGDGQSPLVNSLMASGALGAALWFAMRRELRKYMRLTLKGGSRKIGRDTVVPARELVTGKARVPIESATLRVVAYNLERGQYRRGSGTSERTVSFETPVRALVLYEQRLIGVPADREIADWLEGDVDFAPMFSALYPPVAVGKSHGLDTRWELQFLHAEFVDHELLPLEHRYRVEDFFNA